MTQSAFSCGGGGRHVLRDCCSGRRPPEPTPFIFYQPSEFPRGRIDD
jgi:hypothetical protein